MNLEYNRAVDPEVLDIVEYYKGVGAPTRILPYLSKPI